jgi:hypothetical protein
MIILCVVCLFRETNISCVVGDAVLEFPVYSNFVINTTATIVIADFDFNISVIATSDFAVCVALGVATDVIDFSSIIVNVLLVLFLMWLLLMVLLVLMLNSIVGSVWNWF